MYDLHDLTKEFGSIDRWGGVELKEKELEFGLIIDRGGGDRVQRKWVGAFESIKSKASLHDHASSPFLRAKHGHVQQLRRAKEQQEHVHQHEHAND